MGGEEKKREPETVRRHFRFIVEEDAGQRLDQVIPGKVAELSRSLTKRIIDLGGVHVNGQRVRRCGLLVHRGDRVEVYVDGGPTDPFRLCGEHVLFRDRYLIAVNKPAGVETQPTPSRYKGTLYEALLVYLHDPFRPRDEPELGMAQRLDRETSGVLVFSTHPRSHGPLTRAVSGREVRKRYLALVKGNPTPPEGEIRSLLARNRATNRTKSVQKGGKEAVTRYRILESWDSAALVEVEILTGRSHQIRAHMAEAGHPLLGDVKYGGPSSINGFPVARQMLHSWRLDLPHPMTGDPLALEAPLPKDMSDLVERLRSPL